METTCVEDRVVASDAVDRVLLEVLREPAAGVLWLPALGAAPAGGAESEHVAGTVDAAGLMTGPPTALVSSNSSKSPSASQYQCGEEFVRRS